MSKTRLVTITSLIVIVVMLFLTFQQGRGVPEFETVVVERGTITTSIFSSGEIKPAMQADVFAKTSGTIWSLPVEDSQTVYQGQLLLQLDSTSARAVVAQKELALQMAMQRRKNLESSAYSDTDLKAAEAFVNERRTAWVRAEEDYNEDKTNEARQAIRDAAYTAYLQAEESLENLKTSNPTSEDWAATDAEIESAQKALVDAQLGLSRTTITASRNGILIFTDAGTGKISQTSVVSNGQKLFTIADFSSFVFEAEVDESEIERVDVNQKARATLDTYSGTEFEGQVSEIAKITSLDSSGNKVVEVEIRLNLKSLKGLYLGLSGDVEIILEERKDVLLLSAEALVVESGQNFVYVLGEDGNAEKRKIEVGLENDDEVEVLSGISEGEEVVIGELEGIKRGESSRPRMRFLGK